VLFRSVPRLSPGVHHEETFQIPTQRRAVIALGPVRSSRGDALGLMRREMQWTEPEELFVHPKTISLDGSSAGFLRDLEGKPTTDLSSSDVAFHALRDYEMGDDLRHIHWRSSAKVGKFMVRQFEETRRSHLVVCLSMDPKDYADDDAFELSASVAASLGLQAIREEKDLTVLATGRELWTRTGMRMLDDFSRLEFGGPTRPVGELAREAAAAVPDASTAILVVGAEPDPATLHGALARFPINVMTLVCRCSPGLPLTRRNISDSPVLSIGDLEDLPRAMRSVGL
jgi:uncharacterized protein (DUF58 family)